MENASIPSVSTATEPRDDDVSTLVLSAVYVLWLCNTAFSAEPRHCVLQALPDSFSQALEHAATATHSAISDGANRCLV